MGYLSSYYSDTFNPPSTGVGSASTNFSSAFDANKWNGYSNSAEPPKPSTDTNQFKPSTSATPASTQEDPNKNLNSSRWLQALNAGLSWKSGQTQPSSTGSSGIQTAGGGVQQSGDLTFAYPMISQETKTTAGKSGFNWGQVGALAGAAIAAPFTGGMSLSAAAPIIGMGAQLGGTAGSLFSGIG
jgi:hypothetical protein